jgi:inosine-uridine nucleoside N-ribohydrolase
MRKPVLFIDTDMGLDDIIAICMIVASNAFDICGISVVNGVSPTRVGIRNLTRILSYLGVSIPLYLGIDQRTQRSRTQFPCTDRRRAKTLVPLATLSLPDAQPDPLPLAKLTDDLLVKKSATILCLGPLSNIARFLISKNIRNAIQKLIIMGGSLIVPGNVPPRNVAEYNIRLDPRAADYVLRSDISTTLVPIDATRFVPASTKDPRSAETIVKIQRIKPKARTGEIIRNIIAGNDGDFQQFYDPLAAMVLIDPSITTGIIPCSLGVVLRGQNIGKLYRTQGHPITIVDGVNAKQFYTLLLRLVNGGEIL